MGVEFGWIAFAAGFFPFAVDFARAQTNDMAGAAESIGRIMRAPPWVVGVEN